MTDSIALGLDGATWTILDRMLERRRLPRIQSLVRDGQASTMESTFPPITAPAWLSMATGQNPGKTGVFYFLNRESADSFEFEPLGSDKFRGQSFWDVLSAHDESVGVFNYPMLYPPYETNGFMVSGLGSEADGTITYPESLEAELDKVTDGYQVKVPYADPKYQGRPDALNRDLLEIIDKRERAIDYLLSEKDPDHFFGIISATDWAQHYFWRHYDEDHVLHDPEAGHQNTLQHIWERVDETVGMVAEHAKQDDADLLIVSDHGFGPINRTFHSNRWLQREGFTQIPDQSLIDRVRTEYFPYLRRIGETVVSIVPPLNEFAKSVGESVRKSPGQNVDMDASIAFAPRQNLTCGMIYMLSDESDDKRRLTESLERVVDESSGVETVDIYEPDDLYHGPKVDLAPDILFEIDGFECAVDPRPTTSDVPFSDGPPSEARNGGHNRNGIFIASGPNIAEGVDLRPSIYDIAPTILHLHGQTIPEEMDGSVLTAMLEPDMRNEKPETAPLNTLVGENTGEERSDHEDVQQRLEDLGYI